MIILDSIKQRIASFEAKELFKISVIYFLFCVCLAVGIIVRYAYMKHEMKDKMTHLNNSRSLVQDILTQYQTVQQQRNKVDVALQQNKTFNIQKFFQDLVQKYQVAPRSTFTFKRQKLPNGYIQESLDVHVNQIDTKLMCELLLDISQEPIVYTLGVDISKAGPMKKINLAMSIATLKAEE